ncbi:MAG TPA: DUF1294 domain-containing protein [Methanomassiliicoccales archaeon]|jgi:uncharacterized membrane protein YsdA (DUF1294 family)
MTGPTYLLIALVVFVLVNGAAFLLFRKDKLRARNNGWRTPEGRLLTAAFFGPYGSYLSMLRYRHKTKHAKFLLVPLFVILQTALLVFLIMRYWTCLV